MSTVHRSARGNRSPRQLSSVLLENLAWFSCSRLGRQIPSDTHTPPRPRVRAPGEGSEDPGENGVFAQMSAPPCSVWAPGAEVEARVTEEELLGTQNEEAILGPGGCEVLGCLRFCLVNTVGVEEQVEGPSQVLPVPV